VIYIKTEIEQQGQRKNAAIRLGLLCHRVDEHLSADAATCLPCLRYARRQRPSSSVTCASSRHASSSRDVITLLLLLRLTVVADARRIHPQLQSGQLIAPCESDELSTENHRISHSLHVQVIGNVIINVLKSFSCIT